jgi:hypothetical protein
MPSKSSRSCFKSNDAFPMPQPHAQFAYAPRTVPMVNHQRIYGGLYLARLYPSMMEFIDH